MFRQITAISAMNLRNIPSRLGTSSIIVIGIAGVVAVLVGMLSMAAGFNAALTTTANPARGIVLGHGSGNEMSSWLTNEQFNLLAGLDGVRAVSGELYAVVDLEKRSSRETAYVVARGVTSAAFDVRPELRLTRGRMMELGHSELVVGEAAARQFEGLDIGDRISLRDSLWTVVGHFVTGGTSNESEIWMDLTLAQSVFRRQGFSTARMLLSDPQAAPGVARQIAADPRLDVSFETETDFYAGQAEIRTRLIETFTYFIASIMAVGAIVAALNAMFVAVSSRTVEIGTLRSLGFGQAPVVASVVLEALVLAALGGICGVALVYFAIDGLTMSTLNGASNTQVAFAFSTTPTLLLSGLLWALALGFLGGLVPAVHAARLPITAALRGG